MTATAVLLTLVACFMIACRVDKMMRGVTQPAVFLQHATLGLCLFASVVIRFTEHEAWGDVVILSGVVAFFGFSMRRWKSGAPEGTAR